MPRQRKRPRFWSRSPIMTRAQRIRSTSPDQRNRSRSPITTREDNRSKSSSPVTPKHEVFPRDGSPCKSTTPPPPLPLPPPQPASGTLPLPLPLVDSPQPRKRKRPRLESRDRSRSPIMTRAQRNRSKSSSPIMPKHEILPRDGSPCKSPSPPSPDSLPLLLQPGYMKECEEVIELLDSLYKPPSPDDAAYERQSNSRKLRRLLHLTEGFYAGKWKYHELDFDDLEPGAICPDFEDNYRAIEAAKWAISQWPDEKGEKPQFVELVRVNSMLCSGYVFYLTIKASDNKFYEANVYDDMKNLKLRFIRLAHHYANVDPKILKFDAPHAAESV